MLQESAACLQAAKTANQPAPPDDVKAAGLPSKTVHEPISKQRSQPTRKQISESPDSPIKSTVSNQR